MHGYFFLSVSAFPKAKLNEFEAQQNKNISRITAFLLFPPRVHFTIPLGFSLGRNIPPFSFYSYLTSLRVGYGLGVACTYMYVPEYGHGFLFLFIFFSRRLLFIFFFFLVFFWYGTWQRSTVGDHRPQLSLYHTCRVFRIAISTPRNRCIMGQENE